jgi:hypothetical protein
LSGSKLAAGFTHPHALGFLGIDPLRLESETPAYHLMARRPAKNPAAADLDDSTREEFGPTGPFYSKTPSASISKGLRHMEL